jgi:O-antigen/teichoic acid export membrane protein
MRLNRTKNAISGTFFGTLLRLYRIIGPFIIRTVFIYTLGVEYLGLDSLFTSIMQTLSVAELGVGRGLVFSMYKPIAENDKEKLCALLKLYEFYYRIIGIVIMVAGISLTPILPKLINGSIPDNINLYVIYYMNLFTAVMSYWFFAYRNSLFNAFQRTDVISRVGIFTNTVRYILQIILLVVLKNYYWYLILSLFEQILNNITMAYKSREYFPEYRPYGNIESDEKKKINRKVKDLFCSKIGAVINNSFDTIIISAFLGLTALVNYQNYYYVISSLIAIFSIFYKACLAGIGNSLIIDGKKKNYDDFKRISYMVFIMLNFCISCLISLYEPFMKLWLRKSELMLDYSFVILFTFYFGIYEITMLLELYKDASGSWHKDRFRPLIAAIVNLGVNIVLVQIIGLYGIIVSTILSYIFINLPWVYKRLFEDVFNENSAGNYLVQLLKYCSLIIISAGVCRFICTNILFDNMVIQFIFNLVICTVVSCTIFIVFTSLQEEFGWIRGFIRKRVNIDRTKII